MHHEAVTTTTPSTVRPGFGPIPSVPRMDAAAAGVAAAGLALGISEAIAALLPGAVSLLAAVGQAVIDRQPPGAKDFVVALFCTNDKLALEIVVVLVSLAAGAAPSSGRRAARP